MMAVPVSVIVKAVGTALSNEKTRKGVGWAVVAILSPIIVIIAVIFSLASGGAEHNRATVSACFYGTEYPSTMPAEFRDHVAEMQTAFARLDSAIAAVNSMMETGNGLDPLRVKSVFFALCFGEDAPNSRAADSFVSCFYTTETRTRLVAVTTEDGETELVEQEYTVAVPLPLSTAYSNAEAELGRMMSSDDMSNIDRIYAIVAGTGAGGYSGEYLRGNGSSTELDTSIFADPTTKNAADLVSYALYAWESGWGYVWGTYGETLTESLLEYKSEQYPDEVGVNKALIRSRWLDSRTADCIGLIKGFCWLDTDTQTVRYGANGMPDVSANGLFHSASVSGSIDTMPDRPGLAVWYDGHIGVYVGDGYVVEAMGTRYGVVKTRLEDRGWTHWLQIDCIEYD